jgi:hypothetical protein
MTKEKNLKIPILYTTKAKSTKILKNLTKGEETHHLLFLKPKSKTTIWGKIRKRTKKNHKNSHPTSHQKKDTIPYIPQQNNHTNP